MNFRCTTPFVVALFLSFAPFAQANTLTSTQVQSILSLLSSFGADASILANVQASLTSTPVTSCSSPTKNLALHAKGSAVLCLQRDLLAQGYVLPSGATGYFGLETKRAVQAWQRAKRITPALGYFGPLSRARWHTPSPSLSTTVTPERVPTPTPVPSPIPTPTPTTPVPTPSPTPTPTPVPTPTPTPTQAPAQTPTPTWTKIADEGGTFTLATPQTIRYGTDGAWFTQTVNANGSCSNTFFGGDPKFGIVKRCEAPSGTVLLQNPTPAIVTPAPPPASASPVTTACGADSGGWTIPIPTPVVGTTPAERTSLTQYGSRLYYVSSATGDDPTGQIYFWDGAKIIDAMGNSTDATGQSYGTDPMNPSSAVKAFKRWAYVGPRQTDYGDIGSVGNGSMVGSPWPTFRAGYPDWWLFKRGDTFDLTQDFRSFQIEKDPKWVPGVNPLGSLAVPGGRSATERQIVGAYGSLCTPRPHFIHPQEGFVTRFASQGYPSFKNVAYLSLDFDGHDRSGDSLSSYAGVTLLYQGLDSKNILFEDMWFDAAFLNISNGGNGNPAQVEIRRSLVTDNYTSSTDFPQGIYYEGTRDGVLRIEDSIFMRNGFPGGDPTSRSWPPSGDQTWSVFGRNMYISGETNSMQSGIFDTVSMIGASGDQFRPGLRLERNFFYQGYVGVGAHGGYPDSVGSTGSVIDNVLQRFVGTGTNSNLGQPGWGISLGDGANGVEVARNIVTGAQYQGVGSGFGLYPLGWYCYNHTFHYPTRMNTIHDNIFEAPVDSAPVSSTDGLTNESPAGCAGWTYPGVKGNTVSNNTLISPFGKIASYAPVGGAVGTTDTTAYSNNTLYASRAAAASALGWSDPNRTLKSYLQSQGITVSSQDGFIEYFNLASKMQRGSWDPRWTSKAIVNYFKTGFGMVPLP